MKRMKQLTYHHILEKRKGGKATVENGAILSVENHEWFNKQPEEVQKELNKKFQEYKKCKIEFTDELDTGIEVKTVIFEPQVKKKNKDRKELQRLKKEWEDR